LCAQALAFGFFRAEIALFVCFFTGCFWILDFQSL
jgi:hypothetical protein